MVLMLGSCSAPLYLPTADQIDVNQYGSCITIKPTTGLSITGELLAITSNKLIVLTESDNYYNRKPITIPLNQVSRFTLRYAYSNKHYGWTIPAGFALPLIPFPDPAGGGSMPFHGFFALVSIPFNLIVTISATAAGEHMFEYNYKNITYDQLRMFARFPQGIPPTIDLTSIR